MRVGKWIGVALIAGSLVLPPVLRAALDNTGVPIRPFVIFLLEAVEFAGLAAVILSAHRRALGPSDRHRSSVSGTLWQFVGLMLMIGAFPIFIVLFAVFGLSGRDYSRVSIFLTVAMIAAGRSCYTWGKRHKLLSADELMVHDTRPPVLYLRSFKDDAAATANPVWKALLLSPGAWKYAMASEEEQIAEVMNGIGPFVAIGRPGAKLPEVGAARMYVDEAEWQAKVEQLTERACLVVFRPGNTAGFWWEMQTVVRMLPPEKIVFLLPYGQARYERFRDDASKYLARPLPDYPVNRLDLIDPAGPLGALIDRVNAGSDGLGTLKALLHFERDWTPRLQLLDAAPGTVRRGRKVAAALRAAIEPVARQLGVAVFRE
jgi:hypothetical protein